jgi:hypothetical protein
MTPALRLVVTWMVCALAVAAWYRARWWQDAAEVCAGTSPGNLPAAQHDAIKQYLQARYDEVEYRDNAHSVTGLAYIPWEAPLVEVRHEALRRFLPDTRFLKTAVQAPYMEYPRVETLVSFRRGPGGDDIRSCLSPTYGEPSRKFMAQFTGIFAPTLVVRRELALALAELLAETVGKGSARLSADSVLGARAEIWQDRLHWRNVDVTTDGYGRVNRIVISNPLGRSVDIVISGF